MSSIDLPMTALRTIDFSAVVLALKEAVPSLSAVYAFGSQVSGEAGPESDLDVALMSDESLAAEALWGLSSRLAGIVGCHVDLLDLRSASTVMQYRIVTTGQRLWARDEQAALYETFILSQKTALDEARAGLLDDIQKTGAVYGR
ncbi:nucleotidyltransferase domain-containing protein [Comamonas aquatica]|uniref:type VII toxin-antitoxin system MntA family adenylyltransferase antitoxin n=2 Tax=Comamonas aquatica TaxID=225991 RepID=UPI0024473D9F|nr:nucleotidyltransferase domain-containing protein [Comamonas aquatica]MDH0431647.1 nucleotidyltransferase domain-containing protein [Comamonas aquatica]MDH1381323.1 nucleotidyltransferase domain-containing protein [Comamonas aquatica]MDH1641418.1 nucleotidyltransferase domain-containing protein [Comamonas aquatica]MDH1816162.1 nucleotidyltransferase domain-containing protein [Comamonas aquatica]